MHGDHNPEISKHYKKIDWVLSANILNGGISWYREFELKMTLEKHQFLKIHYTLNVWKGNKIVLKRPKSHLVSTVM